MWVDLRITNYDGEGYVTIFAAHHDDPRFPALVEFIRSTWPEEKAAIETTDAPHKYGPTDIPF